MSVPCVSLDNGDLKITVDGFSSQGIAFSTPLYKNLSVKPADCGLDVLGTPLCAGGRPIKKAPSGINYIVGMIIKECTTDLRIDSF